MKVGDAIVLEQSPDDKDWWGGHVRGGSSRGHFPKAFVQRMESQPQPQPELEPEPEPEPQPQPEPLLHAHDEPAKMSMEDLRRELAQSQADNAAKDKELDELRARLKQTQ